MQTITTVEQQGQALRYAIAIMHATDSQTPARMAIYKRAWYYNVSFYTLWMKEWLGILA